MEAITGPCFTGAWTPAAPGPDDHLLATLKVVEGNRNVPVSQGGAMTLKSQEARRALLLYRSDSTNDEIHSGGLTDHVSVCKCCVCIL